MVSHSDSFSHLMQKVASDPALPVPAREKILHAVEHAGHAYSCIGEGSLRDAKTCEEIILDILSINSFFRTIMAVSGGKNIYGLSSVQQVIIAKAFHSSVIDLKTFLLEKRQSEELDRQDSFDQEGPGSWLSGLASEAMHSAASYAGSFFSNPTKPIDFEETLSSIDGFLRSFENEFMNVVSAEKGVRKLEEEVSQIESKLGFEGRTIVDGEVFYDALEPDEDVLNPVIETSLPTADDPSVVESLGQASSLERGSEVNPVDKAAEEAHIRLEELNRQLVGLASVEALAAPIEAQLDKLRQEMGDVPFESMRAGLTEVVLARVKEDASELVEDLHAVLSGTALVAGELAAEGVHVALDAARMAQTILIDGAQHTATSLQEMVVAVPSALQEAMLNASATAVESIKAVAQPIAEGVSYYGQVGLDALQSGAEKAQQVLVFAGSTIFNASGEVIGYVQEKTVSLTRQGRDWAIDNYILPKLDPQNIHPLGLSGFLKNHVWFWLPVSQETVYDGGVQVSPTLKGKALNALGFGSDFQNQISRNLQVNLGKVLQEGANSQRLACTLSRTITRLLEGVNKLDPKDSPEQLLVHMGIYGRGLDQYKKEVDKRLAKSIGRLTTNKDVEIKGFDEFLIAKLEAFRNWIRRWILEFALARHYPLLPTLLSLSKKDPQSFGFSCEELKNKAVFEILEATGVLDILKQLDQYADVVCYHLIDEIFTEMAQIVRDEEKKSLLNGINPWKDEDVKRVEIAELQQSIVDFRIRSIEKSSGEMTLAQKGVGFFLDRLIGAQLGEGTLDVVGPTMEKVVPLYRDWVAN